MDPIGVFFSCFWVSMQELTIFDLKIGFYAKCYPYSQFPRSRIFRLGQNIMFKQVFNQSVHGFIDFIMCF